MFVKALNEPEMTCAVIYLGTDKDMLQRKAAHQQSIRSVQHVVEVQRSLHTGPGRKPAGNDKKIKNNQLILPGLPVLASQLIQ